MNAPLKLSALHRAEIAKSTGYREGSALFRAVEEIYAYGIREGREEHRAFKKVIDELKAHPAAALVSVRPSVGFAEAVQDAKRDIAVFRNLPTHVRQRRGALVTDAKRRLRIARYFRRFGARLWAKQAA